MVGAGVNTRMSTEELPVPTATSLQLCGAEVDKADLVAEVVGTWSVTAHNVDTDLGAENVRSKPATAAPEGFACSSVRISASCTLRS